MVQQAEIHRPSGDEHPPAAGNSHPPEYGQRNTHKPMKAIIGIAILLILSFVLYQFRDKSRNQPPTPAPASQGMTAPKS
jgi:hypothetical protein